ncbi:MAG: SRPBCC family protein [Candidatus Dormibacterales bacterium]
MNIENAFEVGAAPERVYSFLLDVNRVVGCVPGAELAEIVDPTTFKGRVKIKVGPVTVAYNGTAKIASRDDLARSATLEAEGRETTGPGSARATAQMRVAPSGSGGGSSVTISTEYQVAGRVAQFGRGVMEDVSRRLVGQMAACIKEHLEAEGAEPTPAPPAGETSMGGAPPPGAAPGGEVSVTPGPSSASPTPAAAAPAPQPTAAPVNALSLMLSILWDRLRGLFGGSRRS